MDRMTRNPEAIARIIRDADRIAICSHINPDGDTLGCATAMRLGLQYLGKSVFLFCDGKVPDNLAFLPGAEEIRPPEEAEGAFDLLLTVDISDVERMGACAALMERCRHTAQIDHHPTNPLFMEVNSVDGKAPAACVLIREQLRTLEVPMTEEIAICLYTGISTDTGNFAFAYTNAECFRIMAELMECGLPLARLNRILFRERSREQLLLLGRAIESIRFYDDGQIAVMTLTARDFQECGALSEHADKLVNYAMDTVGVRMAMLAREDGDGTIKFSLRARQPDTVNDVAQRLGGGGHPQASGMTREGTLEEQVQIVLKELREKLANREDKDQQ
jgi:phosphoesterase RecJ-like protein